MFGSACMVPAYKLALGFPHMTVTRFPSISLLATCLHCNKHVYAIHPLPFQSSCISPNCISELKGNGDQGRIEDEQRLRA